MKCLLLPLLAVIALPTAVNANVDPKVAEFCLKAADFAGCVKTMTTKSSDIPSMRLIQGKTELTGNSCPSGFAYAGAGNCKNGGDPNKLFETFENQFNLIGISFNGNFSKAKENKKKDTTN